MAGLNIRPEYNDAARRFPELAKRHPAILANTLNRTATAAKRETVDAVAKALRLPRRIVANRLTRDGQVKEDRFRTSRASAYNLNVVMSAYARGIPVYQVAGHQLRRKGGGVKAKGGRFYQGAFKVQGGRYNGMVFKRMGPERTPLMMPKIGERKQLEEAGAVRIVGSYGRAVFDRIYTEQLRAQAAKYGVRT